ncbi:hypothetical protein D3C76_1526240 [compost metagenome]
MRNQQDELLTTKAGDEITAAQALAQHAGDNLQHLVASQVAIAVVDTLEMVKIEDRH